MAASRRHSCGSLVRSEPLHECCVTSCFHTGKGMTFDVKSLGQPNLVNSSLAYLQFCGPECTRSLNLWVEIPRHVRIPKSQCMLAASLFFGLLMSHSVHYETPDGTEDEDEEEDPTGWDRVWISSGPSDSSFFSISVFTDYEEIGIRPDGMSLFRSCAYCICSDDQRSTPETLLRHAGVLRKMVVEGLDWSQATLERFIEGDFNEYVQRMAREETLGGEVEISMASYAMRIPIRVYRQDKGLGGLVLIAAYGTDYVVNPIHILYKGDSPSDAFEVPARSRRRRSTR